MSDRQTIDAAPGLTIRQLQAYIDKLGVSAIVINEDTVLPSDIDKLANTIRSGVDVVVYLQLRDGPSTKKNPSGHFIALIGQPNDTIELYDPAGERPRRYLDHFPNWLEDLMDRFTNWDWFEHPTQPTGSNSCGPWTAIRINEKSELKRLFTCMGRYGEMAQLNRNDTQDAFGPIGRELPHMSGLKAQAYGDFLQDHTNLNEPASKHIAHVINRACTNSEDVAASTVADVMDGLQKALPKLQVSDEFMSEYGPHEAGDFNDFVKSQKKKRAPACVADVALGGRRRKRGGALLAGSTLGGSMCSCGGALPRDEEYIQDDLRAERKDKKAAAREVAMRRADNRASDGRFRARDEKTKKADMAKAARERAMIKRDRMAGRSDAGYIRDDMRKAQGYVDEARADRRRAKPSLLSLMR